MDSGALERKTGVRHIPNMNKQRANHERTESVYRRRARPWTDSGGTPAMVPKPSLETDDMNTLQNQDNGASQPASGGTGGA